MKYLRVLAVALSDGGVACVCHDDSHFNAREWSSDCTWKHTPTHLLQNRDVTQDEHIIQNEENVL